MTVISEQDGISYEQLQMSELDACVDVISQTFSSREGMVAQQQITPQEFRLFAEVFAKKGIQDQLTMVARDMSTGVVVGALLADDFGVEPSSGLETLTPKFNPIIGMLDGLVDWYREHHLEKRGIIASPGKICNLMMMGVLESHTRRGICLRTTQHALELAKSLGFQHAVGEFTSQGSATVGIRVGLQELHAVDYDQFEFEGGHPFKALGAGTSCRLLAADL